MPKKNLYTKINYYKLHIKVADFYKNYITHACASPNTVSSTY